MIKRFTNFEYENTWEKLLLCVWLGLIYGGRDGKWGRENMGDFEYLGCLVGKRVILMGPFWGVFLSSQIRENISRFRGCSVCNEEEKGLGLA